MAPSLPLVGGVALLLGAAALGLGSAAAPARPGPPAQATTAQAASAASVEDPVPPAAQAHVWPTGGPVVVARAFDPPPAPWARGHRGADLTLAPGAPVLASADGTVAFAGAVAGRGVVSIDHPGGIRTTYEPVTPTVAAGDAVRAGDVIGHLSAASHCAPSSCLHWGARRAPEDYLDPLLLLRRTVVRLYPPA